MIRAVLSAHQTRSVWEKLSVCHRQVAAAFAVWGGILQDTAFPQMVDEDYSLLDQIFINKLNLFFATEAQEWLRR